ncbi:MAG: hypothetical protein M3Y56_04175, partial [Armatimonadota bacterium]|nr:hypothetical protein [Armatimonadota bacterium]
MRRTDFPNYKTGGGHRRKSLVFSLAVAATFLLMGRAPADSGDAWSTVAPSGAEFTVLMPGDPEEHTATIPTSVGSTVMHIYLLHDGSKFYSVSYCDYPSTSALFDAQAALCGARDGALRKAENAVVLRDVDFTFQGFPAKGIVLQLWGGQYIYRCRMYLVGTRLYQMVFAAPPSLAHA